MSHGLYIAGKHADHDACVQVTEQQRDLVKDETGGPNGGRSAIPGKDAFRDQGLNRKDEKCRKENCDPGQNRKQRGAATRGEVIKQQTTGYRTAIAILPRLTCVSCISALGTGVKQRDCNRTTTHPGTAEAPLP